MTSSCPVWHQKSHFDVVMWLDSGRWKLDGVPYPQLLLYDDMKSIEFANNIPFNHVTLSPCSLPPSHLANTKAIVFYCSVKEKTWWINHQGISGKQIIENGTKRSPLCLSVYECVCPFLSLCLRVCINPVLDDVARRGRHNLNKWFRQTQLLHDEREWPIGTSSNTKLVGLAGRGITQYL